MGKAPEGSYRIPELDEPFKPFPTGKSGTGPWYGIASPDGNGGLSEGWAGLKAFENLLYLPVMALSALASAAKNILSKK